MPHKYYHGRTGIIWNVTPHAVGVIIRKQVRNRLEEKKIHVRIEHVRKSKCRDDLLKRIAAGQAASKQAKATGKKVPLKRSPELPKPGHFVRSAKTEIEQITPLKYEELM